MLLKQKQVQYDETLYNLVVEFNKKIENAEKEFGVGVREQFTKEMIFGINNIDNVRYIPPLELLNKDLVKKYFESWDINFADDAKMATVIDPKKSRIVDQIAVNERKNC